MKLVLCQLYPEHLSIYADRGNVQVIRRRLEWRGLDARVVPVSVGQIPIYYNHKNTGRPADAKDHYTSRYLDIPWTPLWPFGHGRSYTAFTTSAVR